MSIPDDSAATPVKCLLVDDLEDNLFTMSALLQAPGVEVITASSGFEALERLLEHDVALALLDVQMPGMDGFELAELIRGSARTRHIPLIFVTAASREQWRLFKGYDVGAVDFLFKPVEPWVLQSKAQVFYDLHRGRLQLAEQLRERTETLRMNEMFAAVLAHDLRGPLSAMLASALLLERRLGTGDDSVNNGVNNSINNSGDALRQTVARITNSGQHMRRMIDDLLDLTRARLGGGIPIVPAPADLRALAEEAVDQQRKVQPQAQIELVCEGSLAGHWDADRLRQLLANLVGNAVQHGSPGQPVLVHVDGSGSTDAVVLTVANDGVLSAASRRHLFQPFGGGSSSMDRGAPGRPGVGLGLGLYIADQIARGHGGTLHADASDDARTVFTVTLPR